MGKSFVELEITESNYVVINVFSIMKKWNNKKSGPLGLLNDFTSNNFDRTHFRGIRKLRKATIDIAISVCPSVPGYAWNISAANGRLFMKFGI